MQTDRERVSAFVRFLVESYKQRLEEKIERVLAEKMLQSISAGFRDNIDKLSLQLKESLAEKEEIRKSLLKVKADYDKLLEKYGESQVKIAVLEDEIASVKGESARLYEIAKRNVDLEEVINNLTAKLDALHDKLHSKEEKITSLLEFKGRYEEELKKKDAEKAELERKLRNLEGHNRNYKLRGDKLESDIAALRDENARLCRKIDEFGDLELWRGEDSEFKVLSAENERLKRKVLSLETAISEISDFCDMLRKREKELMNRLASSKMAEADSYKEKYEELYAVYKDELARSNYRLAKLKADQQMYEEEIERLKNIISGLRGA